MDCFLFSYILQMFHLVSVEVIYIPLKRSASSQQTKQKQNISYKVCCTLRRCYELIFIILWDICLQFWRVKTWILTTSRKVTGTLTFEMRPHNHPRGRHLSRICRGSLPVIRFTNMGQTNRPNPHWFRPRLLLALRHNYTPWFQRVQNVLHTTALTQRPDVEQLTGSSFKWIKCGLFICSGTQGVHDPPVLLTLGGELVVKCCGTAVDPVGRGGAAVFAQSAVWQVQHGSTLEGLQVGRGNEAWDRHWLFMELQTHERKRRVGKRHTKRRFHTTQQLRGLKSWLFFQNLHFLLVPGLPECWFGLSPESSAIFPGTGSAHPPASRCPAAETRRQISHTRFKNQQGQRLRIRVANFSQPGVWWWHRAARGSRCCNTATRSASDCWRACPPPLGRPTSQPSSSSRNTAPWTGSRPWRSPICSGWGCWSKASGSPATTQTLRWESDAISWWKRKKV